MANKMLPASSPPVNQIPERTRENTADLDGINEKKVYYAFINRICSEKTVKLKTILIELEKDVILHVLEKANGNQKRAAKFLGIKYTTLNEKIKRFRFRRKKHVYYGRGMT